MLVGTTRQGAYTAQFEKNIKAILSPYWKALVMPQPPEEEPPADTVKPDSTVELTMKLEKLDLTETKKEKALTPLLQMTTTRKLPIKVYDYCLHKCPCGKLITSGAAVARARSSATWIA